MTVCTPTGTLADPELPDDSCPSGHAYVCSCGEPLRRRWDHTGLDSYWVDSFGTLTTTNDEGAAYLADPKGFIDRLIATDMPRYSLLRCQIDLGMFPPRHGHYPVSCGGLSHDGGIEVPWCHQQPMQATRDGWRCRTQHTLFIYGAEAAA